MNFSGYDSNVNGIKMYYEIHGEGQPLVLIHGGGSTIDSTFGRIISHLARSHQLIAVELQNHGRTDSRKIPETFEQDAEDVSALLKNIGIGKASFFGFSNGGHTAMQIAINFPQSIEKLVIASAPYKRTGFVEGLFEGLQNATLNDMPEELRSAFLKVTPDPARLQIMFDRDRERMIQFEGWDEEQIKSIVAPTLLINGDADVITPEGAVEMFRLIPHCKLLMVPGGHGEYIGEITTLKKPSPRHFFILPLIEEFLMSPG